jgi:hypothetical protein
MSDQTLTAERERDEALTGLRRALGQNDTIVELRQSLARCQREREALEAELDRLRAFKAEVKTVVLYLSGAVDETLAGSGSRFARDAVAEAGARVLEALADD